MRARGCDRSQRDPSAPSASSAADDRRVAQELVGRACAPNHRYTSAAEQQVRGSVCSASRLGSEREHERNQDASKRKTETLARDHDLVNEIVSTTSWTQVTHEHTNILEPLSEAIAEASKL